MKHPRMILAAVAAAVALPMVTWLGIASSASVDQSTSAPASTAESPPDDLESLEETIAILSDPQAMAEIADAEADIAAGNLVDLEDVRRRPNFS